MNSGNNVNLCCQGTNLRDLTTIRTLVILKDHLTYGLFLILIYCFAKDGKPLFLLGKCLFKLSGDVADVFLTSLLLIREYGSFHLLGRNNLLHLFEHFGRNCAAGIFMLLLTALCNDLINESDDGLVYFMCLVNGFDHLCLRDLICTGLDHDHFLTGGCDGKVQIAFLPLLLGRVHDQLAIDHTHLGHGTRAVERNIRNAGSDCGTDHCHQFRTALGIHAHYHIVQGYVVPIILREQGTHRSVDHAAGQNCVFTCLTLTLVKATGDLTNCIHLLLVFYTQGEEINAIPGFLGCRGSTQNSGITIMHECASVGLFANSVYVDHKLAAGKV